MNEKIKGFFSGIISAFIFIGSIILGIFIGKNRHRTDSDVGTGIENAKQTCETTKDTIGRIETTTESAIGLESDIERTNEQLTESIGRSEQILEELKKRNSKK